MSRRKKKRTKPRINQQQKNRRDVIQDTAAVFTCSTEISGDFAYQCQDQRENLEADLAYTRAALRIWQDQTGPAQSLIAALTDLLTARQRHHDSLAELQSRFSALATNQAFQHIHLEPVERYAELVRNVVFPNDARPASDSD